MVFTGKDNLPAGPGKPNKPGIFTDDRLDRLERLVVADFDGRNDEAYAAVEKIREEQEKKGWVYNPGMLPEPEAKKKP